MIQKQVDEAEAGDDVPSTADGPSAGSNPSLLSPPFKPVPAAGAFVNFFRAPAAKKVVSFVKKCGLKDDPNSIWTGARNQLQATRDLADHPIGKYSLPEPKRKKLKRKKLMKKRSKRTKQEWSTAETDSGRESTGDPSLWVANYRWQVRVEPSTSGMKYFFVSFHVNNYCPYRVEMHFRLTDPCCP